MGWGLGGVGAGFEWGLGWFGLALVGFGWVWVGLGRVWVGFGRALGGLWVGFGLALGGVWVGFGLALGGVWVGLAWLRVGFGLALGGVWLGGWAPQNRDVGAFSLRAPKSALKCDFAGCRSAVPRLRGCIPAASGAVE